ncbi:MAG TPA: hypothetical protein VMV07_03905 [Streptosporangiaceae bacterium]|nr:hypothetical protein [Streptosporangiaceae bacterium]
MSSAILYLAIVAIWAFLLVPRWVRRPHTAFFAGTEPAGHDAADGDEPALAPEEVGDADGESAAPRLGVLRAVGLLGGRSASADWRAPGQGREHEAEDDQPEPDTSPLPRITAPRSDAAPAPADASAARSASRAANPGPAGPAGPSRPPRPARPPISRTKIVQARRRLLTTLVLLAFAAATCTALGLTSPWVCVPPAGMLGMYLLLLREAALADAETARWRAEQADAARRHARARARQAWAARTPQPTAEVIDISARLGDQLYDQYADATVRAVGD